MSSAASQVDRPPPTRALPGPSPRGRTVRLRPLAPALLLSLLIACGSATQVPPGAQTVHVAVVEGELRLEPSVVHPGDVYLVLSESANGINFVHRSSDPGNPHSAPLPVTEDDIRSVARDGSFQGANQVGLAVGGGGGNVSRIGPLVEGKYVLLIDRNEEAPRSAELLELAVLEVRD